MMRRVLEFRAALRRWWSGSPKCVFGDVLDAAIDQFGTTQIRLRAYELEGAFDDSALRRAPASAGLSEREEKRV